MPFVGQEKPIWLVFAELTVKQGNLSRILMENELSSVENREMFF